MPRYRVATCDTIPWGYVASCARDWREALAIWPLFLLLIFAV